MSAVTGIDNAQIAREIISFAKHVGSLKTDAISMHLKPSLEEEERLVGSASYLFKQKTCLEEFVAKSDAGAKALFDVQMGKINKTFKALFDKYVEPVFNKRIERKFEHIDGDCKAVIDKIEQCFSSGKFAQLESLGRTVDSVSQRIEDLTEEPKKLFGKDLSPELKSQMEKLVNTMDEVVDRCVSTKLSPVEDSDIAMTIMENLSTLIKNSSAIQKADFASWNDRIAQALFKEDINVLDWEVYMLSKVSPKGGHNWGFEHRFDDLLCLQHAFNNVLSIKFLDLINSEGFFLKGNIEIQNAIFKKVYEAAGSPTTNDPIAWAKDNVGFHLNVAIDAMMQQGT